MIRPRSYPLDVAVFGSFKHKLITLVNTFVGADGNDTILNEITPELAGLT